MKLLIQVHSKKGYYGPKLMADCKTVAGISEAMIMAIDALPPELEGERLIDWTRISIEVERN